MQRISIIILLCIAFLFGLVVHSRIVRRNELKEIKPYLTYTRLLGVARDCDGYRGRFGTWPKSLSELRALYPDLNEWAVDMWGRDVIFVPFNEKVGYGQVISYGQDGKSGGKGEDQDCEVRFPVQNNKSWNDEVGSKLKKPELRAQ